MGSSGEFLRTIRAVSLRVAGGDRVGPCTSRSGTTEGLELLVAEGDATGIPCSPFEISGGVTETEGGLMR
jgi:hypothetical protein